MLNSKRLMKRISITRLEKKKYKVKVVDSETKTDFEITFRTLTGVIAYVVWEIASEEVTNKQTQ